VTTPTADAQPGEVKWHRLTWQTNFTDKWVSETGYPETDLK